MAEFTSTEILELLALATEIKAEPHRYANALRGKTLALLFEKPSTRTRVSFEVAMFQLGGLALNLPTSELQLSRGESVADTARTLSRYVDGVMARVYKHESLVEMAKHATVPIINGLSDLYHPCQILADLLTVREKFGRLKGLKLAYVGDGNNVANTLLIGASKVGMDISVATPSMFRPYEEAVSIALESAKEHDSKVELLEEPEEAVRGADIVYTDTFISMGMEKERELRLRIFLPKYQVNERLMSSAKDSAVFMHCLPAHRGEEVTDGVIDGPCSIVFNQAENRLHAQKALLVKLLTAPGAR